VMAVEGPGSTEAEQSVPRPRMTFGVFDPTLRTTPARASGVCATPTTKSRSGCAAALVASNRGRFRPNALGRTALKPLGAPGGGAGMGAERVVRAREGARRGAVQDEATRQRVVQRALIRALEVRGRPMGVCEAQMAVEALLGHGVSRDSVNSCLSIGARGVQPRFRRVAPGCYRLARDP
jgi:hypothetical protein